jgi:hypothetical protein
MLCKIIAKIILRFTKRNKEKTTQKGGFLVGTAGFEPATS